MLNQTANPKNLASLSDDELRINMRDMLSRIAYPRRDRDENRSLQDFAAEIRERFSREELGID